MCDCCWNITLEYKHLDFSAFKSSLGLIMLHGTSAYFNVSGKSPRLIALLLLDIGKVQEYG